MYSELVCLDSDGKVHQWKWEDLYPYLSTTDRGTKLTHPRTKSLGLSNENIVKLSSCSSRATVVTRSGKVNEILWCR